MNRVTSAAAAVLLLAALAGCHSRTAEPDDGLSGDDRTPEKKWGEPGYDADKLVVIQLCLPARKIEFDTLPVDLAYLDAARQRDRYHMIPDLTPAQLAEVDKTVRKARLSEAPDGVRFLAAPSDAIVHHGYIVGDSPSGMELRDSTQLGQPVFEARELHPEHYIAIHVRTMSTQPGKSLLPEFWFRMPAAVGETWTAWSMPQAENANDHVDVNWQVLQARSIAPMPIVSPDAPRMRFRLASNREWADARRRWYPAVWTVIQQIQPDPPASEPTMRLQPQSAEVIPGC